MKKLLFTGGTGFLGKNIMPLLMEKYEVVTCGITPDDAIQANLAKEAPKFDQHFDTVLHACGKAHVVPKTEAERQAFFDVNYQGTVNLCSALEKVGVPKALVFISTVAVYGCEYGNLITEEHPLNGGSPYAKSKIMAEKYLTEWGKKHNVVLGILRPSLLAGKNAPGNLGAMVNGVRKEWLQLRFAPRCSRWLIMRRGGLKVAPELNGHTWFPHRPDRPCLSLSDWLGQIRKLLTNRFNKNSSSKPQ